MSEYILIGSLDVQCEGTPPPMTVEWLTLPRGVQDCAHVATYYEYWYGDMWTRARWGTDPSARITYRRRAEMYREWSTTPNIDWSIYYPGR